MKRVDLESKGARFKPGKFISACGMSLLLLMGQTAPLLGNPTGGAVVAGAATIGPAGLTLSIHQSTQNAIINWQQFSIAGGETTKFIVPNSGATLNRVTGGNPSAIYGNLQSNGTLYLVNPSGIVVGPSGRIDTAGFLASTLDISNQQFLAGGNLEFAGPSDASVENDGIIHASTGDVYLIANQVSNKGTLSAPEGTVGLAAGSDILFQPAGSQLFVQATPTGTTRATGVTNAGTIRAAAAELKAAGGNAYALAINNTGVIAATGYKKINGQVYLTSDGGSITNSGKISAQNANGTGGTIVVDGTAVSSPVSGIVTNSGALDASATVAGGKGGTVTLKNMGGTTVHGGKIIAKGGQGGAGGNAEVSGKSVQFTGTVDLTASGGTTGNLLFDPENVTIETGGGLGASTTTTSGDTITGEVNNSILTVADLESALANANITVTTGAAGSTGAQSGDITVSNPVSWTAGTSLTLSAYRNINVDAGITNSSAGTVTLRADNSATGVGTVAFANGAQVSTAGNVNIFYNPSVNPAGSVVNTTSYVNPTENFTGDVTGGAALHAYMLVNTVYDLQNVQNNLTGKYALNTNIDATTTSTWNGGAGFVPIGTYDYVSSSDSNTFSGVFNGQGNSITGLTIDRPNDIAGTGLFGDTASGSTVENLSLINVNVNGLTYVGGLAGVCNATLSNVDVSGSVTGTNYVGGLTGISADFMSNSYSTASVTGNASANSVGGLDGFNQGGFIQECYSSGTVTAGSGSVSVGGLVGSSTGTVTQSFWDTTTSGQSTSAGGTGDPTATLLALTTYTNQGWSIDNTDLSDTWVIFNGQTRPLLSMEASSTGTITNAHQLQLIGVDSTTLGANYTLGNNIDLSGTTNASDIWGTSTTNSGTGFVPLGTSAVTFTGTFNGQGHTINALYIDSPNSSNVGLFGYASGAATIENLGLTNAQVTANNVVGALMGDSYAGTISNVYVTGAVIGVDNVGGLGGGIGGTVTLCYSTCSVSGYDYVGGLVGTNYGTITNSYSTGAVTGNSSSQYVGGLVGYNYNSYSAGTISNCYSTGAVSGTSDVGGLLGYNNSSTITNSFWDTNTAGVTLGVGTDSTNTTAGVSGATTNQLETQSFFPSSWNFTSVWSTVGNTTTPQLVGLPQTSPPAIPSDTLSGTAYTNNGTTISPGVTIDLIYDGSLLGSPVITNSSGAFSFTVSSADLTSGILLTDATDKGNTFYQANSPSLTINGIDLWGSTLRVLADTASNTALGTAAGSLTAASNGVNYTVNAAALATNAGVNLKILDNFAQDGVTAAYTLDGNITASGALSTSANSALTASAGTVTLAASSMALAGSITSTGKVNFNSAGTITDAGAVQVGSFILQGGTWSQIVGQNGLQALPAFAASSDFELQGSSTFERFAGTDSNSGAHEIADVYGLQGLASPSGSLLGANVELTSNINASGTSTWNSGAGFVPIGYIDPFDSNDFSGTFNGLDHTINDLDIHRPNAFVIGLFAGLASGGTVENVGLTNVQVSGTSDVGALAGINNSGGTVEASYATGSVSGSQILGGLVGGNYGLVETSHANVAVSGSGQEGGLVGDDNGQVETSYATGAVTAASQSQDVGGLVGFYGGGTISGSYSTGAVSAGSGSSDIGGLVGEIYQATLSSSSSSSTVTGSAVVGGLVGLNHGGTITGSSTSGTVLGPAGSEDLGGLVGTNEGTVSASSSSALVIVGNASGGVGGVVGGLVGWNDGGTISSSSSSGAVVVGNGNRQVGALVGTNEGTLGTSFSTASVTAGAGSINVGGLVGWNDGESLSGVYSAGPVIAIGSTDVGGLVGLNDTGSTLSNAYSTGSVSAGGASFDVGGLAGANYGSITDDYSTGAVVAGAGTIYVGGLVGYNNSVVSASYSSSSVNSGMQSSGVGGLVGGNDGTLSNVYGTGAVTGDESFGVGGLVGANTGTISDAYSTGTVSAPGEDGFAVGGLVGEVEDGAISTSFWDTTTSTLSVGVGRQVGGTDTHVYGLTTPDLLLESTYAGSNGSTLGTVVVQNSNGSTGTEGAGTNIAFGSGFNIGINPTSNTWVIFNGQTRPLLGMEYSTTITNAHQLQLIGLNSTTLAASYTLANNIDLSSVTNASEVWGTSTTNGGAGFVPIGNSTTDFAGTFNGQNHTINDLYIHAPSTNYIGLFGQIAQGGLVENVGLTNDEVSGSYFVGGLVGNNDGSVEASYATGPISGVYEIGGLVGNNYGTVESSNATGTVSGTGEVGGLVGYNDVGGAVETSYATGAVTGGADVGGLVGINYGTVETSDATGALMESSGATNVGGLVGLNNSGGIVEGSYATGAVTVSDATYIGGLVGTSGGTIETSYATGAVTATTGSTYVGGLVGSSNGTVETSDATGIVIGTDLYVGGLAGYNGGTVETSYATGSVGGGESGSPSEVGGLVGLSNGTVTTSYATGPVSGSSEVGGLVGNNGGATIHNSYFSGTVTAANNVSGVGGLVGENSGSITTSYSAGSVTAGTGSNSVGGLVGSNAGSAGTINNTYSVASVTLGTGSTYAGGLVGYNGGAPGNYGSIGTSYSTGLITATGGTVGGLVGVNFGTITHCFFDTATTGRTAGVGANAGTATVTGSTTTSGTNNLLQLATYTVAGWNFGTSGNNLGNTWVIFSGSTRPLLSMEYSTTIANAHQLQLIGLNSTTLSANYTLANDINLSALTSAADIWGDSTTGFVPIGTDPSANNGTGIAFSGTFNGQGHVINDLSIDRAGADWVGLFGEVASGGTVENMALTNVNVSAASDVGALAGIGDGAILNCYSTGTVESTLSAVGGLVGVNGGTITNTYSSATVSTGSQDVGGLVGSNLGTVFDSYSTGTVSGSSAVGGLVGYNPGTITSSYSSGMATGTSGVGGLAGENNGGTITSAYSTGAAMLTGSSADAAGGLVGDNGNGGTISNSFSSATVSAVSGSSYVGGLVGSSENGSISNSYSTGPVTAPGVTDVGGLLGDNNGGSISTSYSKGTITASGATDVGGLVGSSSGGTIADSYFSTNGTGQSSGVGGISGTTITYNGVTQSSVTGLTLAQMAVAANFDSNWNFTNIWTTLGNTTTPQLQVRPVTITGTAYTDQGVTISPNVGIDLIADGSLLDSSYSDASGDFFFTTSSGNLLAGTLLTDATDKGNTFFQYGGSLTSLTGIDISGSTLRIVADTASNSALKTAIGSLSGDGINYAVAGTNLSTASGINLSLNNDTNDSVDLVYTLDGNMTAGGTLSTPANSTLSGSTNVTLTGSSVVLDGTFTLTGSLGVTSTAGAIDIYSPSAPDTAQGITLNAAGQVSILATQISTDGGDFSARGNGSTGLVTNNGNGDQSGTFIYGSTINAQGGNVNLAGNAGYYFDSNLDLLSGSGVYLGGASVLETTDSGNITIDATWNQPVTSTSAIEAFSMNDGTANSITTAGGQISIIGNAVQGTSTGESPVVGVEIGGGATLTTTGTGGSISLTGYVPATDAVVSTGTFTPSYSAGIEINGNGGATPLSIASGGSITLNGAGGTVDTSASTFTQSDLPFTDGVLIADGAELSTGTDATLAITGTGGNVITTSSFTGNSEGFNFSGSSGSLSMGIGSTLDITGYGGSVETGGNSNGKGHADGVELKGDGSEPLTITIPDGGAINITGTGGYIDTTGASAAGDTIPGANGVDLKSGVSLQAEGSTTITITGTGGTVNPGEGAVGSAAGVLIGGGQSGETTQVTSQEGAIHMTGTGGASPELGAGVMIYGFDGSATTIQSYDGGAITVTGIGGSGYEGTGFVAGNYIPSSGVSITDNVTISTGSTISLTGTGGSNSNGVVIQELTSDAILDSSPALPTISAGGAFTANALSSTGIYVNGSITAGSAALGAESTPGDATTISSGPLTIQDASIVTTGGDVDAYGSGYVSSNDANGNSDGIEITGSTINADGGNINLTGVGGYILDSSVGPTDGGLLGGFGVSIANDEANDGLIETTGTGNINIQGTFSQSITSYQGIDGVSIYNSTNDGTNTISVAQGTLSITGTVSQATFGDGTSQQTGFSGLSGVYLAGSEIEATGTGGSVSVTGNVSGTTTYDNSNNSSAESYGIDINSSDLGAQTVDATISVGANGILAITGTAGAVDSTYATGYTNAGESTGVEVGTLTQITGGAGATVSLTGTGGSAITNDSGLTNLTSYSGRAEGVDIGENSSNQGGIAQITVGTGGSIGITGHGGALNISNDATPAYGESPDAQGVHIKDSTITANGSASITIQGTGGTVTAGSNTFGGATGVSFDGYGGTNLVSAASGPITIIGVGGASPSQGDGVTISGFNGATTEIKTTSGNLSITGTGGAGYDGSGALVENDLPNAGIVIADAATLMTGGAGPISLTGTGGGNGLGGSNSNGIEIVEIDNSTIDASPVLPTITAGGALTVNALSGTGIYVNGTITAASATLGTGTTGNFASITSGPLDIESSTITLAGGFTAFGLGSSATQASGAAAQDGVTIDNSTISSTSGNFSLTGRAGYNSVDETAGYGISMDDSSLTTLNGGNLTLIGNASVPSQATVTSILSGVSLTLTTLSTDTGSISITGTVNSGTSSGGVEGLDIFGGSVEASANGGSITLTGDTLGSAASDSGNTGASLYSDQISTLDGTGIQITGTAGSMSLDSSSSGFAAYGVSIGSNISTTGSAPIVIMGTGGTVTDNSTGVSVQATGTDFYNDYSYPETISSGSGNISITGIGGSVDNGGFGVNIYAFAGSPFNIESATGNITINGTGGTGNPGTMPESTTYEPNIGVAIGDAVTITATTGHVTINGTGNNAVGIKIASFSGYNDFSTGPDPSPTQPQITAGGAIAAHDLSGTGIDLGATIAAPSATLTSAAGVTVIEPTSFSGGLFLVQAPVITLNAAIAAASGNIALVDSSQFVNTAGAGALSATNGTWRVWSINPPGSGQSTVDTVDGLTPNFIQYGATYGVTTPAAAGNGLLYTYAPSDLVVTLAGTSTEISKTYDGSGNLTLAANSYTATSSELVGGDSISAIALTGTLNSPDVGIADTLTVSPTQVAAIGTINQNGIPVYGYTVSSVSGAATITPAPLTFTANPVTKTYDGTDSASDTGTLTGTLYTNVGTGVQDSVSGGTFAFTDPNAGAGDKTVDVGGVTISDGNGGHNYSVTYVANNASTINQAPLTITADSTSKTYGQTITFAGTEFMSTGLQNGETIGTVTLTSAGAVATANVAGSPYAILASGANGGTFDPANYNIAYANGSIAVLPATLTYVATPVTITEGTPLPVTYGGTVTGFVNGETLATATTGTLVFTSTAMDSTNAGDYPITGSGLTANNGNYTFAQADANNTALMIVSPVSMTTTTVPVVAGAGPNIVPAALIPQNSQVFPPTGNLGNRLSEPPPFDFMGGAGGINVLGALAFNPLAESSSNGGNIVSGDVAQISHGELDSVTNPTLAGELNEALGPIVYQNLADALKDIGDWADVPATSNKSTDDGSETILNGGDVAEMTGNGVKQIPLNQAPGELQKALGGDVLKGVAPGH